jgi:hypothetical protein
LTKAENTWPYRFEYNSLVGNLAKEVVRSLLEKSGYLVYPYGYESFVSELKRRSHKSRLEATGSMKRLRSQPDLIVQDDTKNEIRFVEVKFSEGVYGGMCWTLNSRMAVTSVSTRDR